MAKTLCDWKKSELEKHPDKLFALVKNPQFYCRKCARVANTSKVLCKPRKLPGEAERSHSDITAGSEVN
jgi:hypothetical protein